MQVIYPTETIVGVLLAGGSARRMGGCDKCLLALDHQPILEHVIVRAVPQVSQLLLSSNSDATFFSRYNLPILPDTASGFAGPLAGIHAAMQWIQKQPETASCRWLASFPTDSPFFPEDLIKQLAQAAAKDSAAIACAASNGRQSPLFAFWSMELINDLAEQLKSGDRKVGNFLERHRSTVVNFEAGHRDPFFNINTPEDLKAARDFFAAHPSFPSNPPSSS